MTGLEQDDVLKVFRRSRDDFAWWCKHCVTIIDKQGQQVPLALNKGQIIVNQELEKQREKTGKVRALICKARQQGISTLIPPRFLHRILHYGKVKAFALTDHSDHSQNIYNIFRRSFHSLPIYKCKLEKETSDEMVFEGLDASYSVGTARSDNVGRSSTVQLFHGSEAAYWPKSEDHMAGVTQSVPYTNGTEIILESTANGIGNVFYRLCMEGQEPGSDWKTIFLPWYITDEYAIEPEAPLTLDNEEEELTEKYQLTHAQLNWRRIKIREVGDVRKFRQEYPTTIDEAFLVDSDDSFITSVEIAKANSPDNPIVDDKNAPMVIGIDPSWRGKDDAAYAVRKGRIVVEVKAFPKFDDANDLISEISRVINYYDPDKVYMDVGGPGGPMLDSLKRMGYWIIEGVNFGERAEDFERYHNKRAEMYDRMKRWLNDPPCQLPHSQQLKMELGMTKWPKSTDKQKLLLAPKSELDYSPNLADALAMTFAGSVPDKYVMKRSQLMQSMRGQTKWDPYAIDF